MHRSYFHCFLFPLLALAAHGEISVTAVFKPPRVAQGDTARYIVEIKETSSQRQPESEPINSLPIPQVRGLELRNGRTSTSRQTRIINGAAEYSVTQQLIIDAKASGVGRFAIPSYTFEYKGETLRVPDAALQVVERPADAGPTADELIFLKADAPDQLYVGQTTEIELKLYISNGVRLSGLNNFDRSADGFTVSELPDAAESSDIVNGRRYRVLSWPLTITPIRTGPQDLDFEFTLTASLPGQNNRRNPLGRRGFGGSLFDDFFGRTERFTVYTEPKQVDVLPLPTTDRPDSFSGAIGDFSLQVYTDHRSTEAGEPIMLSVEVAGRGNFDRINGPTLKESPSWRSYAPEAKFEPRSDGTTQRGTKRFDYVLIPQKTGELTIPPVEFAYFDPDDATYVELSSPAIDISVSPSDRPAQTPPTVPKSTQGSDTPQPPDKTPLARQMSAEEALLTLDYRPRPSSRVLTNPLHQTAFWLVNTLLATLLCGCAYVLRRRRRLAVDPAYADLQSARTDLRAASKAAQAASDASTFYADAQRAIRLALTCRTQRSLRSAQSAELSSAMQSSGVDDSIIEASRQLFADADAFRFGAQSSQGNLDAAKAELERILKAL
ncbi:MAG: hypothetical protein GVY36_14540 [Verrucomicrobia bacterium]|jgi:hypothetical protein|nr:hypothetical protein [Verrucomicrobiota bacterium]